MSERSASLLLQDIQKAIMSIQSYTKDISLGPNMQWKEIFQLLERLLQDWTII